MSNTLQVNNEPYKKLSELLIWEYDDTTGIVNMVNAELSVDQKIKKDLAFYNRLLTTGADPDELRTKVLPLTKFDK